MQASQNALRLSMQNKDAERIGFMATFTGDPIKRAFDSRRGLQTARERTQKSYVETVNQQELNEARQTEAEGEGLFSATHFES